MINKLAIAVGVVLLVVAGGICAVAQTQNPQTPDVDQILAHLGNEVDLTERQQFRIRTILSMERPTFEPLMKQLAQAQRQMREATTNGKFDEAQVRAIAVGQAQTMSELIVLKERVRARIYNEVLTSEQRIQAARRPQRLEQPVAVVPITDAPTIR
jgi:Spy/CpxP family protein refolding chaperone